MSVDVSLPKAFVDWFALTDLHTISVFSHFFHLLPLIYLLT